MIIGMTQADTESVAKAFSFMIYWSHYLGYGLA